MPANSQDAKAESKLKKQYPNNPHAVFGPLNKMKMMHGNKPTKKGMQKAHKGMKTAMD